MSEETGWETVAVLDDEVHDAVARGRSARITWASDIAPRPVVWAWQDDGAGRIPAGALVVAAGREGTGKSSFGIWMTAQITRGTLPGTLHGTPRRVFYVAVEDSWQYTLVPRLMAAGADLGMVGRFEVQTIEGDEVTLSLPVDNLLLEEEVEANQVALVVVDPLMSVFHGKIDTHREQDTRRVLDPLARMADRTGAVFLGIAHFNKGAGTDAASLITGSGAFKNVPRAVFGFARDDADEEGGRVLTQVKNSLGRDDLPSLSYVMESVEVPTDFGTAETGRFRFTGQSTRTVADVLRDGRGDAEERGERDEAAAWLIDHLTDAGGSAKASDIIKAAAGVGFAKTTLHRARTRAGIQSRKAGFGGGWAWELPTEDSPKVPKIPTFETPEPSEPSLEPSPDTPARCQACGEPMHPSVTAGGYRTHPTCEVA